LTWQEIEIGQKLSSWLIENQNVFVARAVARELVEQIQCGPSPRFRTVPATILEMTWTATDAALHCRLAGNAAQPKLDDQRPTAPLRIIYADRSK